MFLSLSLSKQVYEKTRIFDVQKFSKHPYSFPTQERNTNRATPQQKYKQKINTNSPTA